MYRSKYGSKFKSLNTKQNNFHNIENKIFFHLKQSPKMWKTLVPFGNNTFYFIFHILFKPAQFSVKFSSFKYILFQWHFFPVYPATDFIKVRVRVCPWIWTTKRKKKKRENIRQQGALLGTIIYVIFPIRLDMFIFGFFVLEKIRRDGMSRSWCPAILILKHCEPRGACRLCHDVSLKSSTTNNSRIFKTGSDWKVTNNFGEIKTVLNHTQETHRTDRL